MRFLTFVYALVVISSCAKRDKPQPLIINYKVVLDSIPSGSGIVVNANSAYIVGDDATGLYQLNLSNLQTRKLSISGLDIMQYREPKSTKHDFEALTQLYWHGNDYLLALG